MLLVRCSRTVSLTFWRASRGLVPRCRRSLEVEMLDEKGREIPDSQPMARPLHIPVAESLADRIRRMVRFELSQQAEAQGEESFEDADDFDVGDDEELKSPYELDDTQLFEHYGNKRQAHGDPSVDGKSGVEDQSGEVRKPGASGTGSDREPSPSAGKGAEVREGARDG